MLTCPRHNGRSLKKTINSCCGLSEHLSVKNTDEDVEWEVEKVPSEERGKAPQSGTEIAFDRGRGRLLCPKSTCLYACLAESQMERHVIGKHGEGGFRRFRCYATFGLGFSLDRHLNSSCLGTRFDLWWLTADAITLRRK